MLKHYVEYYPNTDKLKTFRQTWKGRNDLYEEYHINGNISLRKKWNGDLWVKKEYNKKGKRIYCVESNGYWEIRKYGKNGKQTYCEKSNGYWFKIEYDKNDKQTYYEDSTGYIVNNK